MKHINIIVGASIFIVMLSIFAVLTIFDKDTRDLIGNMPVIAATVGTLFGLLHVSQKVDKVDGQTNGTLSALRAENAILTEKYTALVTVATPDQVAESKTVE